MKNKLYYGDNLDVLRRFVRDETVDLCYIDPPFNSKRNYNQIYNNIGQEDAAQAQAFTDTWTWDDRANAGLAEITSNYNGVFTRQSIELILGLDKVLGKGTLLAYLVSMTSRIAEIHRVLKPTGSFYLHCDPTASHYLKLVCDAIFCPNGGEFQNEIVWRRTNNPKGSQFKARKFGVYTDCLLFYTKSEEYLFDLDRAKTRLSPEQMAAKYPYSDEKGPYYSGPVIRGKSMGLRPNLVYEYKGYTPGPWGWRMEKNKLMELDAAGDLGWSKTGAPFRKLRPENDRGFPLGNLWDDIPRLYESSEFLGYPTQKPEALLERIVRASSNEGDLVLDAYCGCGTTVAVAQRLNRNWIGIDITYQSVGLIVKRLTDAFGEKVMDEVELNGIPKDMEAAVALAHKKDDRTRKEFEKWAVMTFSNNRAAINEKKGGDGGIDGVAYVLDLDETGKQVHLPVLISVKSNKTLTPAVVRDLNGTLERENAPMGFLITLYPMDNLVKEAKKYGSYASRLLNREFPRLAVVSIQEMMDGARMELPFAVDVLKSAERKSVKAKGKELF